jgi:lipoprotein-anchoring transpeptidase ErfK/SrfK
MNTNLRWKPGAVARLLTGAVAVILLVVLGTAGVVTKSWADTLVESGRLLPGTVIAATDVGGWTVEEARAVAEAASEAATSRMVTVRHGETTWETTPAALGAATDVEEILGAALDATASASWLHLSKVRWLGAVSGFESDLTVSAPEAQVSAYVDALADEVDRDPRDATVKWDDGAVVLRHDRVGLEVDRAATVTALQTALAGGGDTIDLAVTEIAPAVTTPMVEPSFPALRSAADSALDRTITASDGDRTWQVTPRRLGAVPLLQDAVDDVVAAGGSTDAPVVALDVPDAGIDAFLAEVAAATDVAAVSAAVDASSGWVEITPEREGRALDRAVAAERVRAAVTGDPQVALPVATVQPHTTRASLSHVLLVRLEERKLYLYRNGERVREWPVAVGADGHETPLGTFTIGAKRELPVWNNPSPDGWGSDMPARIEPGPNNPLGLRALNWHRNGADTLIRFHGTPNTGSIGQASSKGCIRLTNEDVVDLFDLVPTGATVVSVRG